MGMDRSGTNGSPLDFSLTWESPLVNEIISTLALTHICFLFQFLFEMLEAVDTACPECQSVCDLCVLHGLRKYVTLFHSSKKEGEQWLTSSKISNDVDGKPCSRWPQGNRSHVECFQWSSGVKERSWVLKQMKDPLRIILHCIAFCIAFYCQLDLQWENYTMLVFLFYYASVFDFPKCKKLYIALCYGRKYFLPRSIGISLQKKTNLIWNWCGLSFLFCYTCGQEKSIKTSKWQKPTLTNYLE